jgi:hypothetical protein
MDREQLEALRRQVEEDYKLDLAAIERLLRRHSGSSSSTSSSAPNSGTLGTHSAPSWRSDAESRIEPPSPAVSSSGHEEEKNDDLAGSIRSIFSSNGRK